MKHRSENQKGPQEPADVQEEPLQSSKPFLWAKSWYGRRLAWVNIEFLDELKKTNKKQSGSRQKVEVRKTLYKKRETLLELEAVQAQLELREGC